MKGRRGLGDRLPTGGTLLPEAVLDRFIDWVAELGLRLYPAQEQAVLELLAERHVVLGTPTGSGKSLVATFLHFLSLAGGGRSFYTSPTKALASEKFFRLCSDFGPERVGMLTGDAAINRDAPLVCCTAEVLANMAVRQGAAGAPDSVVMDEFHFYSDPERGVAWQVPLLTLTGTQFLLMSATLGDTADIQAGLESGTGRRTVAVVGTDRPVPLDYTWRETPLGTTVLWLLGNDMTPVYVVNFTHRECSETAQALSSIRVSSRDERRLLALALRRFQFDTPYGRELERLVRQGIAVHHAGLLPKYRLLIETLAQQGLLRIVCGTDTLGVGVNVPIRTVLFARLAKFDGARVRILAARDFRQIAGRAGRKGFDDRGSVVCQAPEQVIETKKRKAASQGKTRARGRRRAPSAVGRVVWNRDTFEQLIRRPPEKLVSRFRVTHGMIIQALGRQRGRPDEPFGYGVVVDLVARCYEREEVKDRLLRQAAELFRSLRRAGLVAVSPDPLTGRARVLVSPDLQEDFSLHETLSLYLVGAVAALDHDAPGYPMDVVSVVEAVLEDPKPILVAQERRARSLLLARMKADGVPYDERAAVLQEVTYPQPLGDYVRATFDAFAVRHPWVSSQDVSPKSIARDMLETGLGFNDYVARYRLERSEGLLLRHLNEVEKALSETVPQFDRTARLDELTLRLRSLVAGVDRSLEDEWAAMLEASGVPAADRPAPPDSASGEGLQAREDWR